MSKNKNNNKGQIVTAQQSAIAPSEAPVKLQPMETPLFAINRDMSEVYREISFGANGAFIVAKDAKLTASELGAVMVKTIDGHNSVTVQLAQMLRHSRTLPEVEVEDRDKNGDPTGHKTKFAAYDWLKNKLSANAHTEGAFMGVLQIVPALDFISQNAELVSESLSPFTVKNAIPYFRAFGALPPVDKKTAYKPELMKLDATAQFIQPLLDVIKEGGSQAKVNGAHKAALALKAAKAKEEEDAKAAKMEEERKKAAKALGLPENPAETVTVPSAPSGGDTTAPQAPTAPLSNNTPASNTPASVTPEMVMRDIMSILGNWDKAIQAGATRDQLREACKGPFGELAVLMGQKCEAVKE